MKAVILAGGYGTRISEESVIRPKPLVEIGGKPILWHVMKIYAYHGVEEFIICCGYKGFLIKEYFSNYFLHMSDITFDMQQNKMLVHKNGVEPWMVTLVDTGEGTLTGGRLKRVKEYVGDETFCFTYGDGVADVDIRALIDFHKENHVIATLTAVKPPGRFGAFSLTHESPLIESFMEKPQGDGAWVNGGFFVLEPEVFDYIDGDGVSWEKEPVEKLAREGKLAAYKHYGFWQPMDTLRDKHLLEDLWNSGEPAWKVWERKKHL
ncbi:MAG: glucose-1-phosphate cytidylyltransferase [Desulfovibrionales bacterium]